MTRDIESYQHFIYDQLSPLKGVHDIKSMITLNPVNYTTELPLNQLELIQFYLTTPEILPFLNLKKEPGFAQRRKERKDKALIKFAGL